MVGPARFILAAAAALLMSSSGVLARPSRKEFNMTLANSSPMLQYAPGVPTPGNFSDPTQAWNVTLSDVSYANYNQSSGLGYVALGSSMHTTSKKGARVQISWVGTAIYFLGSTTGAFQLDVDGTVPSIVVGPGLVAGASGLPYDYHTASLTLDSGSISLTNVTLTSGLKTDA